MQAPFCGAFLNDLSTPSHWPVSSDRLSWTRRESKQFPEGPWDGCQRSVGQKSKQNGQKQLNRSGHATKISQNQAYSRRKSCCTDDKRFSDGVLRAFLIDSDESTNDSKRYQPPKRRMSQHPKYDPILSMGHKLGLNTDRPSSEFGTSDHQMGITHKSTEDGLHVFVEEGSCDDRTLPDVGIRMTFSETNLFADRESRTTEGPKPISVNQQRENRQNKSTTNASIDSGNDGYVWPRPVFYGVLDGHFEQLCRQLNPNTAIKDVHR